MSFPAPVKGERFADWQGARHLCTLACPKFSIWLGRCLWVGILEAALVCICWRKNRFYFKASEGVGKYRIISLIPLIFAFLPHYKHQQFISCSLPFSYLNQVSLAFACMSWGSSFSPALPGAYSTLEEKDTPLLGFETVSPYSENVVCIEFNVWIISMSLWVSKDRAIDRVIDRLIDRWMDG